MSRTVNYGSSEFGERLDYKQEKGCCAGWKDRGWAIFFYIQLLLVAALAIIYPVFLPADLDTIIFRPYYYDCDCISGDPRNNITRRLTSSDTNSDNESEVSGTFLLILAVLIFAGICGSLFGFVWLKVMQMFSKTIVRFVLLFNLCLCLFVAIIGLQEINIDFYFFYIGIILFLVNGLYAFCVWNRIPFTAALLSISSNILSTFKGTIWIGLAMIPLNCIWYIIWFVAFISYILKAIEDKGQVAGYVIFLFFISLYWGFNVGNNVTHTSACGVTAAWFFSKEVSKPSMPALKRSLTTSFGSICLGSLIVAILQTICSFIKSQRRSVFACVAICLLACIEYLVRLFNSLAFAQVAIYGVDFITAAKATSQLVQSKGLTFIITNHLIGLALIYGSLLSFVICGLITFFLFGKMDGLSNLTFFVLIAGAFIGYTFCFQILKVVNSSVIGLFVCFAEDPSAMKESRPAEYDRLIGSKQELSDYANNGHTGLDKYGSKTDASSRYESV